MQGDAIRHWDGPGLDAWRPWTPAEIARELAGVAVPWCVVGGWAVELAVGRSHRSHEDIEIAVPRRCFPRIRDHLAAFRFHVVGDGEVRALPDAAVPGDDKHQNWVLDPGENVWRMDVMLEPGDDSTWIFRRDERIHAVRTRMVAKRDGVPYLRPEGVLLFKAKSMREKDEADFRASLPAMDSEARQWLAAGLHLAHPGHPWIAPLTTDSC